MPGTRRSGLALALIAAAGLAARAPEPGTTASTPAAELPRYGAKLEVVLRQARVLVRAPEGASPWGLPASDFRVVEDGRPVEMASVEEVRVPRRGPGAGAEGLHEARPLSRSEAARIGARRWIVMFDSLNPGPAQNVDRLRGELKRFAREKLGPDDEMSLVTVGSQKISVSPFYDDPADIAREVDGQRLLPEDVLGAREVAEQVRSVDERAELLKRGALEPGQGPAAPTPPPVAQQWLPFGAQRFFGTEPIERRVETSRYLRVVEDLARALRVVPGRKVLVILTAGFRGSDLRMDSTVLRRFNLAVRNLMDSGTTVYTIDSTGLTSPIYDEVFAATEGYTQYSDPVAAEAGVGMDRLRDVSNDFFDQQGGSFLLAQETGGQFFQGSSQFENAFERIEELEAGYYLVSWYSTSASKPGDFRSFRVTVDRPGYNVSGPRGYFAEKPFQAMDALDREADLLGLAEWGAERADLPGEARVDVFPDGRGGRLAVVSVVLPGDSIGGKTPPPKGEQPVDIVVAAAAAQGGFAHWDRGSLATSALPTIASSKWWHYEHGVPLADTVESITVVVRENGRGRALARRLVLDPTPERGLTKPVRIRELKGLARSSGGKLVRDPFDFGGIHLAPSEQRRVVPGEKLYLLFEAFALGDIEGLDLSYALVGAAGERELVPGPAPEQVRESRVIHPGREIASILARVPTANLANGDWTLAVRAPGGAEARYPFTVGR